MKHVLAIVGVVILFGLFALVCDIACHMGMINLGYECGFVLGYLQ